MKVWLLLNYYINRPCFSFIIIYCYCFFRFLFLHFLAFFSFDSEDKKARHDWKSTRRTLRRLLSCNSRYSLGRVKQISFEKGMSSVPFFYFLLYVYFILRVHSAGAANKKARLLSWKNTNKTVVTTTTTKEIHWERIIMMTIIRIGKLCMVLWPIFIPQVIHFTISLGDHPCRLHTKF